LLAIVAGFALALGWIRWDHTRNTERAIILQDLLKAGNGTRITHAENLPIWQQILWGYQIERIELRKESCSSDELARISKAFPEAAIVVRDSPATP